MREKPLVLIVDDEDIFLEIASMKLGADGFETVVSKTGKDAILKTEDLLPDLVLSDIYMTPGPNGWELAIELHRNPKTSHIKLAFFTTLRDPWLEIPAEARAAVANELGKVVFLSKIDDVEALGKRVMALLQ